LVCQDEERKEICKSKTKISARLHTDRVPYPMRKEHYRIIVPVNATLGSNWVSALRHAQSQSGCEDASFDRDGKTSNPQTGESSHPIFVHVKSLSYSHDADLANRSH
jgi:hypothetical protein